MPITTIEFVDNMCKIIKKQSNGSTEYVIILSHLPNNTARIALDNEQWDELKNAMNYVDSLRPKV